MNTPDGSDINVLPMICLVDKKSRTFPAPVVYHGVEVCKREVLHAAKYSKDVNGRPPMFLEYPHDFKLVLVGKFHTVTGTIFPCHEDIAEVSDILKSLVSEKDK